MPWSSAARAWCAWDSSSAACCVVAAQAGPAGPGAGAPRGGWGTACSHLPHRLPDNGVVPTLGAPVDDLLIGQHGAQGGAPVDGDVGLVRQAPLEQLQEDPLRPLVVLWVGCRELPVPVKAEPWATAPRQPGSAAPAAARAALARPRRAQALQLLPEAVDVALRGRARMRAGLDGVLRGAQLCIRAAARGRPPASLGSWARAPALPAGQMHPRRWGASRCAPDTACSGRGCRSPCTPLQGAAHSRTCAAGAARGRQLPPRTRVANVQTAAGRVREPATPAIQALAHPRLARLQDSCAAHMSRA